MRKPVVKNSILPSSLATMAAHLIFIIFIYFFLIYLRDTIAHIWNLEVNFKDSVLSFQDMGSGSWTQIVPHFKASALTSQDTSAAWAHF